MARSQALEVQEKRELVSQQEKTVPARYYVPPTDIFETEDALVVVMEVPGVEKKDIDINLEDDTVRIEARINYGKYDELEPLYAEYNVGHFARAFTLSNKIDQNSISAELDNGVLTLTLKKAKEALPRRIAVT
ncbi:MAG TPA: Hsp20/alpha crystallin family protein [Stellaceae bacterium]|nr:Hsp20/alpha crystallin family protein [Stellaceae bacterium]